MNDFIGILQLAAIAGAIYCAGAYVYGCIIRSKGSRHLHTASLLFTGVALANVPVLLISEARADLLVAKVNVVVFLLLSIACQSMGTFRGRKGDRRRAEDAPAAAAPATPQPLRKAA